MTEELKCLSLLNALDKNEDIPEQLAQLFGEPCIKLAEGIKAYISKVRQDRTRPGGIDATVSQTGLSMDHQLGWVSKGNL